MNKLYSKLARVYHEMYQSIFDYKKEFKFYHKFLKKYKCRKILEIGCGSGNLASFFLKNGYNYVGLDLFNEMLKIAREVESKAKFVQGDMNNLKLKDRFDAILITGRSFTYLTTNKDVMSTLQSVHRHLKKNGILIFDNFNAQMIFTNFSKRLIQTAKYQNRRYKRITQKSLNLQSGWTWNLNETYIVQENNKTKVIKNKEILRAFTEDELKLFLKLNNYELIKTIKDDFSITIIAKRL